MTGAIIRNFASIQQDPGAGEPGGPGRMWGQWICEFVLGFLTIALVWSGLIWSGLVLCWFGLVWLSLVWFGQVCFGLVIPQTNKQNK